MIKVTGLNIVEDENGNQNGVQVTVSDDNGNQTTYRYTGSIYTSLNSSSKGNVSVYVTVTPQKGDAVVANSPNSKFDS